MSIYFFSFCICLSGCNNSERTLFVAMNSSETGIAFVNEVIETEALNVMQYEYLYNGGGIGVGDFNNDGLADIYLTGNVVENKLYTKTKKVY